MLREMMLRAKAAGFGAAILTVDVPVAGNRERDLHNGFTIPPRVNARTALQALARPGYLWKLWSTRGGAGGDGCRRDAGIDGSLAEFLNSQLDHTSSWSRASPG